MQKRKEQENIDLSKKLHKLANQLTQMKNPGEICSAIHEAREKYVKPIEKSTLVIAKKFLVGAFSKRI